MIPALKLEITTPTGQVYSKDVDMVTLPGQEGEMGILPMHVPLITLLGDGEIIARRGNRGRSPAGHRRLRRDHPRARRHPHRLRDGRGRD